MTRALLTCLLLVMPAAAAGQQDSTSRLVVTVVDPSGSVVPAATVRVTRPRDAAATPVVPEVTTDGLGIAVVERLPLGRYAISVTFTGFDQAMVQDVTIGSGSNSLRVTLVIAQIVETVSVGGGQESASTRGASSFGKSMAADQIATLSDDPAVLLQQLKDFAGGDAIIRVDDFEGQQLPPKTLIKSIHVTRDQFAAEAEFPGDTFLDVVTQPGVGPLSFTVTAGSRLPGLAGANPFAGAAQRDRNTLVNVATAGTLVTNKLDFSLNAAFNDTATFPLVNQAGIPAHLASVDQTNRFSQIAAVLNYAVSLNQTLKFNVLGSHGRLEGQGVGGYNDIDRAFSTTMNNWQMRIQEAGPIGRRTFFNTRVAFNSATSSSRAATEAPTVVIQDARTFGGAQVGGQARQSTLQVAVDVDHIKGRHSWRVGTLTSFGWFDSSLSSNYLGTYTFADQAAFSEGRALSFSRSLGNPEVTYFNGQAGFYVQDDIRVNRSLTLSPGVRYSIQTHLHDYTGVAPRFGSTWSPSRSGRTTIRASAGIFYYYMDAARVFEPTIRFDGHHQQPVLILNPAYPSPGPLASQPLDLRTMGDFSLQRNLRYSIGVDQRVSPRIRVNLLYSYIHQFNLWRGRNLNAPVNGIRPDPTVANVIAAVTDAELLRYDFTANIAVALAPSPPNAQRLFDWRRVSVTATYGSTRARNDSEGPFTPSPTGSEALAPATTDTPYRAAVSLTSTQLKNLNVTLSASAIAGTPYNWTTGTDDNLDGFFNDRPAGVPLRSLRTAGQLTASLRLSYAVVPPAAAGERRKYRVLINGSATNLTNRNNYVGYSGNALSPYFLRPTAVLNPRQVEFGVTVGF